jgi:hypothetical protein
MARGGRRPFRRRGRRDSWRGWASSRDGRPSGARGWRRRERGRPRRGGLCRTRGPGPRRWSHTPSILADAHALALQVHRAPRMCGVWPGHHQRGRGRGENCQTRELRASRRHRHDLLLGSVAGGKPLPSRGGPRAGPSVSTSIPSYCISRSDGPACARALHGMISRRRPSCTTRWDGRPSGRDLRGFFGSARLRPSSSSPARLHAGPHRPTTGKPAARGPALNGRSGLLEIILSGFDTPDAAAQVAAKFLQAMAARMKDDEASAPSIRSTRRRRNAGDARLPRRT